MLHLKIETLNGNDFLSRRFPEATEAKNISSQSTGVLLKKVLELVYTQPGIEYRDLVETLATTPDRQVHFLQVAPVVVMLHYARLLTVVTPDELGIDPRRTDGTPGTPDDLYVYPADLEIEYNFENVA